jgi:hypothetical protein
MFDHDYTDAPVCPSCGHGIVDLFDYDGITSEEGTRIECPSCEETFESYCHISYSFSTHEVDLEAEKRRREEDRRKMQERQDAQKAKAAKWLPGTRVRIREDCRYAAHILGREGVVPNKELRRHGAVNVTLDATPEHKAWDTSFDPEDLERI